MVVIWKIARSGCIAVPATASCPGNGRSRSATLLGGGLRLTVHHDSTGHIVFLWLIPMPARLEDAAWG